MRCSNCNNNNNNISNMASCAIFIFFSLLALGFLIPSDQVAAAINISTKSSPGRDKAITNPVVQSLNQSEVRENKFIEFNIDEDSYEDLIERIRDEVRDSDLHGIPVLMPQRLETPENAAWLDIRLVAGDRRITVRLEQSNLYVRGYLRSTDDFFWELTDTHLIPGSRDLLFSGSYVRADGVEHMSPTTRENLQLGIHALRQAVFDLDKMENPHGNNAPVVARSFLVLVLMIAEAARFRTISEHISANYWNQDGARIDSRMLTMVNGWERLSTAVSQMDRNPTTSTPLPHVPQRNPTQIYTLGHALAALGILLIPHSREGSMTTMMMDADYGRSLMSLEYVRVNNIDGENPGNLFGTVRVDDGWFTYTFYDLSSSDRKDAGPGGFATLTNPSQSFPVSGADAFIINVDLFDYDSLSPNDEIAKGETVWDGMIERVTFENYDKHLQQVVKGEYGDVTVGYSVLSNALGVTIEVLLENGDGESTADVYGTLNASQVLGGLAGPTPMALFDKSSENYVEVRQWQPIPLTQKVIAASTSTKLTITADLWDHDWTSHDDAIAQGSVDFTVKPGTQRMNIDGRYGQVQVVITCD